MKKLTTLLLLAGAFTAPLAIQESHAQNAKKLSPKEARELRQLEAQRKKEEQQKQRELRAQQKQEEREAEEEQRGISSPAPDIERIRPQADISFEERQRIIEQREENRADNDPFGALDPSTRQSVDEAIQQTRDLQNQLEENTEEEAQ